MMVNLWVLEIKFLHRLVLVYSTGGNYGHQGSGTQKDDEMYHKSQTQMNAARKSMGQGSYNFTKKRKK